MAKAFGGKRPQNLRHTLRRFGDYLGHHKRKLALIGVLTSISALAALIGTYMIRPAVNGILENGSLAYLARVVAFTAFVYLIGALSTLGYTQLMVRTAQRITQEIRSDLFAHLQTMPLNFFDTNRKGDLMSLFTNDVDTISDALNNSFAVVIQMFIQIAGTLFLLFVLNWRLSLLVVVGYIAMFWYINYSTRRSRAYYASQQASLGELDAYMEEMIAGQKVVKVFNHQQADMAAFAPQRKTAPSRHRCPELRRHDDPRRRQYRLHQLRHHCGGGRPDGYVGLVRFGQPGKLPGVCAPDNPAHQPVYPAGQLFVGGAGGRGAYLYGHGRAPRDRRGHGGAGPRAGKRRRHPDRMRRKDRPLGLV